MGVSKQKKQSQTTPELDIDTLQSDVASFASSLGLSSSLPSSGFNDSDFRKTGPLKPSKTLTKSTQKTPKRTSKPEIPKSTTQPKPIPKPKPPVLSLDESNRAKGFDKFKGLPKLPLIKASALGVWYEDVVELEAKVVGEAKGRGDVKSMEEWYSVVAKNRELGERLMAQYALDYESSRGKSGDIKMLAATQRSGTAADKVSAFSVMVGDNPIANLRSLDALLNMVTSKVGKRHALTGFEAVKELFVSSLLPDRKLKTLVHRPLTRLPENKDGYSLLLFWYWEECLKQRYERFVNALEEASRDMLPILKDKALKTIYSLLKSKSEQERRLLSALVNKLGDPQNKGASNADFHLSNLLSDHPNMKAVVIDEVDSFLFRPHLRLRSKYHAVNFLSQIRLSHKGDGPKVAKRLVDVYFALFKILISEANGGSKTDSSKKSEGKKEPNDGKAKEAKDASESHVEMDSRLLSVLLTGVNRAFPFVSTNEADDIVESQTPMLFQLVHSKNFNVGIQALMLLDKISSKNQIVSDRFYRALYSKLLLQSAMNSSKAEMFIGLLLRAMKCDVNLKRVSAFAKRLLQVALQQPPQYACGCLFLLSEVLKARPPLWNKVHQSESNDEEIEHFEDAEEETDNKPSSASNKQESYEDAPIVDETNSDNNSSEDEDDSLPFDSENDVSDEGEDLILRDDSRDHEPKTISGSNAPQHRQSSAKPSLPGGYDPRHREPSFCNADRVSWWELTVLASHVHPSVSTMASTLLSGANIVYNGNPLNDLALSAFLDKLMEKKPKATQWHGGSKIEPAKKLDMNDNLIGSNILSLAEMDVPPEDFVFHKFYMNKMNSTKKPKKKKKKGAQEEAAEELFDVDGGDNDDSDNDEIADVLDSADKSLEADGEYDYDDLDRLANQDDEDLIGSGSDEELDALDIAEGNDFDSMSDDDDKDYDDVDIGDADDGSDEDGVDVGLIDKRKRKRKSGGKTGASPFASLEEYEHMLDDEDGSEGNESGRKKKHKSHKKISDEDGSNGSDSGHKKKKHKARKNRKSSSK